MSIGLKRGTAELTEYNREWKILADETIERLWSIFGSEAKDIQHFGSTSIPNIKAKPIIDITVAVDSFDKIEALIPIMKQNGFQRYENINPEWRLFCGYADSTLSVDTYHIHIMKYMSEQWQYCINFRNYMIANPSEARKYEKIKIDLADKFKNDRESYRINKSIFIEQILKKQGYVNN